jgi:superfamily II DNA or RNA helicase
MIELAPHQLSAIDRLRNGYILCGSVGSGKSRTAIAYYYSKVCGGDLRLGEGPPEPMKFPIDLYIITTAKKRDKLEWEDELVPFHLFKKDGHIFVDSWNNIHKYADVENAFIIFDEQRVVGSGAWVKSFLKMAKHNKWILLSATPGDKWDDYRAVFIANGFFKNKTEFEKKHCVFSPYVKYKKVERYVDTGILMKYRRTILVTMNPPRDAKRVKIHSIVEYDRELYSRVLKDRWDPYEDQPIQEVSKVGYLLRRVVNSNQSRIDKVKEILTDHPAAIIFYNFNYELELLKNMCEEIMMPYTEWNGKKHEEILEGNRWVYLVQYAAGAEGWNCITTDTIIFYSQNYSYRTTEQAAGRIDRMNTPYTILLYYYIRSAASIDVAIKRALENKENFNEKAFFGG